MECEKDTRRAYVGLVSVAATSGSEVRKCAAEKMVYPRLLLFSVLVFASVPLAVAEESSEAEAENGMEMVRRQITYIQTLSFNERGLFVVEGDTELVRLNGPNSASQVLAPNVSIMYSSNEIVIDMEGIGARTIPNIQTLYVLLDPMVNNEPSEVYIGSRSGVFQNGHGVLYSDEDSAFLTSVVPLISLITAILPLFPSPPPPDVVFVVRQTTEGAMRVLQLRNTTSEIPTPTPDDILQITGSLSVVIPSSQEVTYMDSTIETRQGGSTVRRFENIDNFFTYTTISGTQQLLRFQQNANNPSFFPGGGQLYIDSNRRRAFYTDDASVINDIEDETVNQTISFERINGMLNLVNNLLVTDNQIIELTSSRRVDVSGAATIEIDGMNVIFRDGNGREITSAIGLMEFSYYDDNQVITLSLPGSDGTITPSGGGIVYINPDGRAFFSPNSNVNQHISTALNAATATPPTQIRTVQRATSPQGIGSLTINGVPAVTLSGALEIDVGQFQTVMYSNGDLRVRENGSVVFSQQMVNQLSVTDPPGNFEVFNTTAGRTFRGPGRLYVNGNNAFFTTDTNMIQMNTEFVQNIAPPPISFSSTPVDGDQSAVNLNVGGEQFLTLSDASSVSPTPGQVILYDANIISVLDAPTRIPEGATVTYDNEIVSFSSGGMTTNISNIRSLSIIGADWNPATSTGSATDPIPGGGQLFVNPNTGNALYTLTDVINPTTASIVRTRGTVRNTIMNVERLGVFDNNQFVNYQGQSPRLIPGGGTIFTEGGNSFYSRDPALNTQIITAVSELNPVTTRLENGQISVNYNNNTIYTFNPGSATREIFLQNFGVYTYVDGALFNALNPNNSFGDISMVVSFNGFETTVFNSSSTAVNFTGPGTLLVDTQSGTAFFTTSPNTANIIRETRRQVLDTFRRPQIDRPPITTFFTKFPSATAQFGQEVTVYQGADITLECRVPVGNPAPTISFFRDGDPNPLVSDGEYTITNGNLLTVNNAMLNDTRRYTCQAENDVGIDRLSSDLTVLPAVAPRIVRNFLPFQPRQGQRIFVATDPAAPNTDVTFNNVDELVIACKGSGRPKSTIVWSINGDTNFNTSIFSITVPRPGRSVLTVKVSDIDTASRIYSCQAINEAGSATGSIQVTGEGVETAILDCSITRDGTTTSVDPSTVPRGLFFPQVRLCFDQPCPTITYNFVNVSISDCSLPCGCGTQDISVECWEFLDGVFNGTVVNDAVCIRAGEDVPVRQQKCNNFDCPHWNVLTAFTPCSVTCGGGTRTRDVVCVNAANDIVGDEECDENIMPPRSLTCNVHIPCPSGWSAGQWAGCDFNDFCDVRSVTCIDLDPNNFGAPLDDRLCDRNQRPHLFRNCGDGVCFRGIWSTGLFGDCSASCGVGIRTRTVSCVNRLTNVTIDNSFCAAIFPEPPSSTSPCFLQPCEECTSEPVICTLFSNVCNTGLATSCCVTCPAPPTTTPTPTTVAPTTLPQVQPAGQ